MYNKDNPEVAAQMLIRKPVAEVFEAFINPDITTRFWFTKSSGRLEAGKTATWEWEMYQVKDTVDVLEIIPGELIRMTWSQPKTTVDYIFKAITPETTCVIINNYGLGLEGDALVAAVRDLTGGFTTVLDGLKAYLEYGIQLNLVGDKFLP
ncbi:MAG: polyketide cyclase [Bacteroidetes bacterium 43-16]|nr:MAG: polyketide cyclase [Bacteroidetes bacterium 43-16]